jgi:hypothetical protein
MSCGLHASRAKNVGPNPGELAQQAQTRAIIIHLGIKILFWRGDVAINIINQLQHSAPYFSTHNGGVWRTSQTTIWAPLQIAPISTSWGIIFFYSGLVANSSELFDFF